MGEYMNQIPEKLRNHIQQIIKTSGLPEGEESEEKIAQGWLEKSRIFEEKIAEYNMEEVESLEIDEESGALILTYSGSLITLGPLVEGVRNVQYSSIGLRKDVPESASRENSVLSGDIILDEIIEFQPGPVKSTSPVFRTAVAPEGMSPKEQQKTISEVTQMITEEFLKVNKTIMG